MYPLLRRNYTGAATSLRKRHNLTSTVKKRIMEFMETWSSKAETIFNDKQQSNHVKNKSFGCDHTIAEAVSAQLEDGNIKAAAKLLCSGDTPAEICDQTFAELQSKHPTPPTDRPS